MAIRVQHQGAGAGAGIDDGFKRKYDMRMKQQEKVQDRMFQVGLQNRDIALQRENMFIGNNLRAGERQAVRDAKQADWLQDQKAAADQRNLAAANARATLKGSIKAAIDAGEFEKADIDLINKAFADAEVILGDEWKGDDAQKFEALAENQGRLMALAQRRRVRAAPEPVPFDQADPKIQQSIIDRVFDQVAESEEIYSEEDIANAVRGLYNSMYSAGQASSPGVSTPAVPARGGSTPFGLPSLPDTPIGGDQAAPMTSGQSGSSQSAPGFKFGGRKKPQPAPAPAPEPKPILSWDKAIELAMQELTQGENPSPITKDSLHAAAQGFYDKFNGSGQQPAGAPAVSVGLHPTAAPQAASSAMGQQPAEQPTPDYSLFDKPGPSIDWKKMQADDPANEEMTSNLQRHFTGLPPQLQNAVGYAIQPGVDPQGKLMANNYLRENGFDLNLMSQIPQSPRMDWLSLMSERSAEERPQFTAIRKFSESQPPDIQNAIGLVMNPKTSKEAKKKATAHLMNRGINLLEIK